MSANESAYRETVHKKFYRPHDLLWIKNKIKFSGEKPQWLDESWDIGLPVVVRRDFFEKGFIPIGIRGKKRSERVAAWISPEYVIKKISPEFLVDDRRKLLEFSFINTKPLQALLKLTEEKSFFTNNSFTWGVTGSCAYAIATCENVIHDDSDLDILIRCPKTVGREIFYPLLKETESLPCRTDMQIETEIGAFSLKEWMRSDKILLKTDKGAFLTKDPWEFLSDSL